MTQIIQHLSDFHSGRHAIHYQKQTFVNKGQRNWLLLIAFYLKRLGRNRQHT